MSDLLVDAEDDAADAEQIDDTRAADDQAASAPDTWDEPPPKPPAADLARLGESNEQTLNLSDVDQANDVPPLDGHRDVVIHGDPDGFSYTRNGVECELDAAELADVIRSDPNWQQEPVRLVSCEAGGGPAAQELASELGVEVVAATDTVWVDNSGKMTVGSTPYLETGEWRTFPPGASS